MTPWRGCPSIASFPTATRFWSRCSSSPPSVAVESAKCRSRSSNAGRGNRSCRAPCSSNRRSRQLPPKMPASPAAKPAGLSVFFPAYNDSGTIASMVIRAVQAASELTPDYEVIVVNDGSVDATAAIADELSRTYPHVRVIHHGNNRGYGGALQTGFAASTKELIFYTDGDAQYDPAELVALWGRLTPAAHLVNGYKISRSDPLHRAIIGRVYHHIVAMMFGLKMRDVDCDF